MKLHFFPDGSYHTEYEIGDFVEVTKLDNYSMAPMSVGRWGKVVSKEGRYYTGRYGIQFGGYSVSKDAFFTYASLGENYIKTYVPPGQEVDNMPSLQTYKDAVEEWMLALYGLSWEDEGLPDSVLTNAISNQEDARDFCLRRGEEVGYLRLSTC